MIGQTISHYRVLAELGRGGMGSVYRAQDTRLGREVALKVLSAGGQDPERERRLRQEAQAAAALSHPSICVVYEIDEADGATFIAMELVRGESLAAALRQGCPGPRRALGLALGIASGLAEAHARGIVHRDLKPSNVMVDPSGQVKIIDFGLAKLVRRSEPLDSGHETPPWGRTDPGRILGTAAYMSPEQVRGDDVDVRSDVFAFGALLQELLTGRAVFLRETGVETLHAVLKEEPPALPIEGLGAAGPSLRALVGRCLSRDPARRPGLAEVVPELRAALAIVPEGAATVAPSEPPSAPLLRVLVVDDEEPARALLREYLEALPGVLVAGECRNGFEAVKAVSELAPDLVLLDVQMPKLNGLEVVELIGKDVAVIFVTAHDEHAVRAFEVNAVDYLLKPVAPERLAAALERARMRIESRRPLPTAELAAAARPAGSPLARVLVRKGAQVHVIPVEAIDWVEAQDDYVCVRSAGKEFLKQQTLAELEAALDPARFVRIHRSYLLNLEKLARIESEGGETRVAVLRDGTRLPVSRSGYARLRAFL
jgi:two-component system LytT family response regulator